MEKHFDPSFKLTKGNEGLYSKDGDDPGGETVIGLTRSFEPNSGIWPIVEEYRARPGFPGNMAASQRLIEEAKKTYKKRYWDAMGLDRVESEVVCCELFDAAVNLGVSTVLIYTKLVLNSFNKKATLWPDLPLDGTLTQELGDALDAMCLNPGGEDLLYRGLNAWQGVYYHVGKEPFKAMIEKIRTLGPQDWRETFEWGWWTNRVIETERMKALIKIHGGLK